MVSDESPRSGSSRRSTSRFDRESPSEPSIKHDSEQTTNIAGGSSWRPAAIRLLAVAIALVTIEVSSAVVTRMVTPYLDDPIWRTTHLLRMQREKMQFLLDSASSSHVMFDPLLGWRYRPGYTNEQDTVSMQGLRGAREYQTPTPHGVLRVAAFGDSFVYGNEVAPHHTWPALIERSRAGIEVLNYGVGGYGNDQAQVRFLIEGQTLKPHVVLLGFATVDLSRLTNVYRPFRSADEWPLVKPRYEMHEDELRLLPVPLKSEEDYAAILEGRQQIKDLGRHDDWYERLIYANPLYDWSATIRLGSHLWIRLRRRYFDPDRIYNGLVFNDRSKAFAIQMALFQAFVDSARYRGYAPLIVLLPDRESLAQLAHGRPSIQAPLVQALDSAGLPYLDLVTAFGDGVTEPQLQEWFMPGRHYSEAANWRIAQVLGEFLWRTYALCPIGNNQEYPSDQPLDDRMCTQSAP